MTNPFALDTPPATAPAPAVAPAASPPPPTSSAPLGADPFDAPAPQQPRGPRMRDIYGRLLLIIPHKLEEGIPNQKGKPGDVQDRLTADVVILDGGPIAYGGRPEATPSIPHDKTTNPPHKNTRMYISNVGIISQCRLALAKKVTTGQPGMVLGRLGVGEAKGGNNPPYVLSAPTDADKQAARQYLSTVDPFA